MGSDRHARLCRILNDALDLPRDARAEFIASECVGDEALQREIEELVAAEDEAEGFLDPSEADFGEAVLQTVESDRLPPLPGTPPRTMTQVDDSGAGERIANSLLGGAPARPPIGEASTLRHYHIVRELGRGGMGVVYEGYDEKLDRRVAIKSIHWDQATDASRRARFEQEARLLAALDHPNVGKIHAFEELAEGHFLILEFVEGRTLGQEVAEGPLAVDAAMRIATQVAAALAAAHQRGIVHRDLSPGNVMIREDEVVKVLDFGLARSIGSADADKTQSSGPIAGTPSFMSPELLHGAPSTRAADAWAFGCLLYESLTGERAFTGPTLPAIFDRILNGQPDLSRLPEATPSAVHDVLERVWEKDPKARLDELDKVRRLLETADASVAPNADPRTLFVERLRASWQPLEGRVALGDDLILRLGIQNPESHAIEVRVTPERADGWQIAGALDRVTVAARSTAAMQFRARALRPGLQELPSVRVRTGSVDRSIAPVPAQVQVDARPRPDLVGRSTERTAATAWLAGEKLNGTLAVQGDPGSGKTAFVEALAQDARERGLRTLSVAGHVGIGRDLELFLDLLRRLVGLFDAGPDRSHTDYARSRLREYLGDQRMAVDYFVDLLEEREGEPLETSMEQYRWYQLVSAVVKEGPLLLVVDEIEHVDLESMALLEALLQRAHSDGLALEAILAGDFEALPDTRRELSRPLGLEAEPVTLEGLDESDVEELIESRYPGTHFRDALPQLAEALIAHSGGLPGPLLETLGALTRGEDAIFVSRADGWRIQTDVSLEPRLAAIPNGYETLLEDRLARVAEPTQPVLEYAALLGLEFPIDPLEELVDDEETLDDALDDLERLEVIAPARADLSRYRFAHSALPSRVVADLDGKGSRRAARTRRRVAQALTAHHGEAPGRHSEELGLALARLGQGRAALPHLFAALARRVRKRQVAGADRILERITAIDHETPIEDPPQRFEWLSLHGRILMLSSRLEPAEKYTEDARVLAQSSGDRAGMLLCQCQLAQIAILRGRFAAARDLALDARTHALELDNGPLAREAGRNLAAAYFRLGEFGSAREIWEEALEHAKSTGDRAAEIGCENNLGTVHYVERDLEGAQSRFERAVEIAREIDNLDNEMVARVWLSNLAFERGDLEAASNGYREAITAFQKLHNRRALSRNYYNLAETQILRGDFESAIDNYGNALRLCTEIGDSDGETRYRLDLARAEWERGEPDRARVLLSELGDAMDTQPRALQLVRDLLCDRLGESNPLKSTFEEWTSADFDAALESVPPVDRLRLWTAALRLEPELASAPETRQGISSALAGSTTLGEVRERVLLAGTLSATAGDPPEEARRRVSERVRDDLEDGPAAAWARVALGSILGDETSTEG